MPALKTVGIRELKSRLSEYLREVRLGTTLLVTDRGTVIAEIREPETRRVPQADRDLLGLWVEEGRVRAPFSVKRPLTPAGVRLPDGTSQALLDEERGP